MIACIVIVGIALAWLGYESDWLRVNLMGRSQVDLPEVTDEDMSYYDNPEFAEMMSNMDSDIAEERAYQDWLTRLYAPPEHNPYNRPAPKPTQSFADREYELAHKADNLAHFSHSLQGGL